MRLLIRADMDGLACAVLLSEVVKVDGIVFVEPQVLKNGGVDVGPKDIIANLPFDSRCGMWFDHHVSNAPPEGTHFEGRFAVEDSAARVIFDHYKDPKLDRFAEMLEATDRVDAAKLTLEDVLNPEGYIKVAMTVDPRSGVDLSDSYLQSLVTWMKEDSLEELLNRPPVRKRWEQILRDQDAHIEFVKAHSHQDGNVIVTDMRGLTPPAGSRFLVYTLFPTANVALKLHDATDIPGRVAVSLGHSIFNKTCDVNVGELLARYGGGGHFGAGSSRILPEKVDGMVKELLDVLR